MKDKRQWCQSVALVLVVAAVLAGCGTVAKYVHFEVAVPGKVDLTQYRNLAVMDFSVTYGVKSDIGELLARCMTETLTQTMLIGIVPPDFTRQAFQKLHISRSHFAEPSIIKKIGKMLQADLILFGDVSDVRIARQSRFTFVVRQRGLVKEARVSVDTQGNPHTTEKSIPKYVKVRQQTLLRNMHAQLQARLVRVNDDTVLWEKKDEYHDSVQSIIEDGEVIEGDRHSDQELRQRFIGYVCRKSVGELLPRHIKQTRVLAEPSGEDNYDLLIAEGNRAALKNDWHTAGSLWLKARSMNFSRPEAHGNLGILHEADGEFKEALAEYSLAVKTFGHPWIQYRDQVKKSIAKPEISPDHQSY